MLIQGSTHGGEVGAVVSEVVGEFVGPAWSVPVKPGLPSFEEPLRIQTFVCNLSFKAMPRVDQVGLAPCFEQVPQIVDIAALASLNDAAKFLRTSLGEGVATDRRSGGQVSPCDASGTAACSMTNSSSARSSLIVRGFASSGPT